mgnify:CR=1 FL=1
MTKKIAIIAGDGIGPEVAKQGVKVLEKMEQISDVDLEFEEFPFGAEHYLDTGELVTDEAKAELENFKDKNDFLESFLYYSRDTRYYLDNFCFNFFRFW